MLLAHVLTRHEKLTPQRLLGVAAGVTGVVILIGPSALRHLGGGHIWAQLAVLAGTVFAALGSIYGRRFGDLPPLTLATGQFIDPLAGFGRPEAALVGSSVIHALMYAGYVWLASRAGSVFAAQCSYIVTGAGIFWAMALLGERFSPFVWLAVVLLLCGVALVNPRETGRTTSV